MVLENFSAYRVKDILAWCACYADMEEFHCGIVNEIELFVNR